MIQNVDRMFQQLWNCWYKKMFHVKLAITRKFYGSLSASVVNKARVISEVREKQSRGQFAGNAVCYYAAHLDILIQNKWPEQCEAQR